MQERQEANGKSMLARLLPYALTVTTTAAMGVVGNVLALESQRHEYLREASDPSTSHERRVYLDGLLKEGRSDQKACIPHYYLF